MRGNINAPKTAVSRTPVEGSGRMLARASVVASVADQRTRRSLLPRWPLGRTMAPGWERRRHVLARPIWSRGREPKTAAKMGY